MFSWHFDLSTDVKFHPSGRWDCCLRWHHWMVMCMPWYCWTMLRRWLIGGGRFFPKLLGGGLKWTYCTFFFGLGKWQHQLEVAKKKKHLLGSLFALPCVFFCGWISRDCLIKVLFPKMAKDFQDVGWKKDQQQIHCSPCQSQPANIL